MSNSSTLPNPNVYLNYLSPELAFAWELTRDVYLVTCGVSFNRINIFHLSVFDDKIVTGIDMGHPLLCSKGFEGFPAVQCGRPSIWAL